MSTLKIEERFELAAPPDLVWRYLVDPTLTVRCLPGAEITGQEGEDTYLGQVTVAVGPVKIAYRGTVTFEEVDDEARRARLVAKGRERSGSGSADMTMESRVSATATGGSEVAFDSEVRVTGKIVRFGRGMIETVSTEILKEFRENLAEMLRRETEAAGAEATERPAADTAPAPAGPPDGPAAASDGLRLIPLLGRSLRAWLARLFGRG